MSDDKPRNPFLTVWNVFSTFCGIVALSSMGETLLSNLLKWKGFILKIIESYRAVTEPVFAFLFEWLPFSVPMWVGDYLTFGSVLVASVLKGMKSSDALTGTSRGFVFKIVMCFIFFVSGPYVCMFFVKDALFETNDWDRIFAQWTMKWFATVLLGVVILLAINAAL